MNLTVFLTNHFSLEGDCFAIFIFHHGPLYPHFGHLYSIERLLHLSHRRISLPHFGQGNLAIFDVSFVQLVHFIFSYLVFGL